MRVRTIGHPRHLGQAVALVETAGKVKAPGWWRLAGGGVGYMARWLRVGVKRKDAPFVCFLIASAPPDGSSAED